MQYISTRELHNKSNEGGKLVLLDIRENNDFKAGHIQGSINISRREVPTHLDELPHDLPIIIICEYGYKSDQVYLYLKEKHKYNNLFILDGGLFEWAKEYDPSMKIKAER